MPSPCSASRRLNSAAPHARRCSRPVGSAAGSRRCGSAHNSITFGRTRKRHGWALCSDGALLAAVNRLATWAEVKPRAAGTVVMAQRCRAGARLVTAERPTAGPCWGPA
jgi:hypothetical protein